MDSSFHLRREQVGAASTRFLRVRPLVVALGALVNGALLSTSSAPRAQVMLVGGVFGTAVFAFALESHALRNRQVTERWLLVSLALTEVGIAVGSSLTGGLASPLLPILLAPVVVGLAAFGREREGGILLGVATLALGALLVLPALGERVPPDRASFMTAASLGVTLALAWLGVTGLGDAHRRVAVALDGMRRGVIEEAGARAREAEALGARVAHELRNPLTAAKALVQLAAAGEPEGRGRDRLGVALSEMDRMDATLSDYLSLARPLTDVRPEPVELRSLLQATAAVIEARAADAGVHVTVTGEDVTAAADPRRLREALLNLCLNAIQAMPSGGRLVLGVERRAGSAILRVTDDGVGMSPELLARAGEPFRTGTPGGTGLGLALVRSVARMHGGTLRIDSSPGSGTTVSIDLPAPPDGL